MRLIRIVSAIGIASAAMIAIALAGCATRCEKQHTECRAECQRQYQLCQAAGNEEYYCANLIGNCVVRCDYANSTCHSYIP